MPGMGHYETEGGVLVWRRGSSGCAAVFGWVTAAFGLLWALGGVAGVLRSGEALGAVFAVGGLCTLVFGLVMATLRSEVRVDRHAAVIRRSALVTFQETRVPVGLCSAVIAVRSLAAMPRAPRSASPPRYAPTVSVGLLTPQGFVALATELEGPGTDASLGAAVTALAAVTGLPVRDHRQSAPALVAELRAWRSRSAGLIVGATLAFVAVLMVAVAAVVVAGDRASPPDGTWAPGRGEGRGRRR